MTRLVSTLCLRSDVLCGAMQRFRLYKATLRNQSQTCIDKNLALVYRVDRPLIYLARQICQLAVFCVTFSNCTLPGQFWIPSWVRDRCACLHGTEALRMLLCVCTADAAESLHSRSAGNRKFVSGRTSGEAFGHDETLVLFPKP